jgi:xanthine dehydrogenase YagS FAD-binding subunit
VRPFHFTRTEDAQAAIGAYGNNAPRDDLAGVEQPAQYLAGGTTLLDLMKLDVMRPAQVIDINGLQQSNGKIEFSDRGLRLGAMARMSQTADHEDVRKNFPVIAQALQLAASPQIRNMASLSGNVLQRTRCTYFRDTSHANCNKRTPGSGCAAIDGINRAHAVLGTSDQCIASYPGDFAQALLALDAQVEIQGPDRTRAIALTDLHRAPGGTPHIETTLAPGELITAFNIPSAPWAKRSLYLKIRDRQSYEFALASVAIALELDGGTVKQARIALGGVATKPWRAKEAEAGLIGKTIDDTTAKVAAAAAFGDAKPYQHNAFKIELGQRTLIRALHQVAALEIPA